IEACRSLPSGTAHTDGAQQYAGSSAEAGGGGKRARRLLAVDDLRVVHAQHVLARLVVAARVITDDRDPVVVVPKEIGFLFQRRYHAVVDFGTPQEAADIPCEQSGARRGVEVSHSFRAR